MVNVLTIAWYSGLSLPTLICCPCLVVRPAFMMKRLESMWINYTMQKLQDCRIAGLQKVKG